MLKVNEKTSALFSKLDMIIFDIDGVLLDVRESFRQAISQTVQFYFNQILNWEVSQLLITPDETQMFKLAGGFNNDWELTYTAVLFVLVKSYLLQTKDPVKLKNEKLSLSEFLDKVGKEGGGLKTAQTKLFKNLSKEIENNVKKEWDIDRIKKIFQEIYAGVDYCQKLYGFIPEYIQEKGLLNKEKKLIEAEEINSLRVKKGILTGRTKEEMELALKFTGLDKIIQTELQLYDNGSWQKPNPLCLEILAERANSQLGLYMGDTTDDLKTVLNFKQANSKKEFLSAQICRNKEEMDFFLDMGADITSISTLSIIGFLKERIGNGG